MRKGSSDWKIQNVGIFVFDKNAKYSHENCYLLFIQKRGTPALCVGIFFYVDTLIFSSEATL